MSLADFLGGIAEQFETPPLRFATPGDLATHLKPNTVQTPALNLIDAALVEAFNTPDSRLIINMPPQEGKTERAAKDFPIWCLLQNPEMRVIVASHSAPLAEDTGRTIRNRIAKGDLGLQIAYGSSSVKKWDLAGHRGGVFSAGFISGVAGMPSDLLIIDDPYPNRASAESVTYREKVWNAWTGDFGARLAPGAPVIVMMTRWHDDDLVGRLLDRNKEAGWKVLNIPAQAEGEDDPLGRRPGEYMVSSRGRTTLQWELRKAQAGSRDWNAQYQGHPANADGGMFKRRWFTDHLWEAKPYIRNPDGTCTVTTPGAQVIQSWDMTFKDTKGSDFVVGQVWMLEGAHAYLLDQYRERASFTESKDALVRMSKKWPQAALKLVEDKANGTAVIDSLRNSIGGIVPVTPHESKEARAAATTPYAESGSVHLPLHEPFTDEIVEEAAAFPTGMHDDQVDAMTQALNRFYLNGGQAQAWLAWMEKKTAERLAKGGPAVG